MQELIFHHYWQSPVAEKVRVALGFLGANWRSVEIPRIPPKPDLVELTGGYRRTPVLQIGADIYCDSLCILQRLNSVYPGKSLYTSGQAVQALGFANWANGELFTAVVRVVLGHDIESLPAEFLQDRARLYFGPDWTRESISAGVNQSLSQCQTLLHRMDSSLSTGSEFLSGDHPGLYDALCYYVIWFLRGRYNAGPQLVDGFSAVKDWETRVQSFGHGHYEDLGSTDAIEIARQSSPATVAPSIPTSTALGSQVTVEPDGDGGDPRVAGELVQLDHESMVIARNADRAGLVHVHFPRSGYRLNT